MTCGGLDGVPANSVVYMHHSAYRVEERACNNADSVKLLDALVYTDMSWHSENQSSWLEWVILSARCAVGIEELLTRTGLT